MTDLTKMAQELYDAVQFQRTPSELRTEQYCKLIRKGIRRVYLDTGRAMSFDESMFGYDEDDPEMPVSFAADFKLDEHEAILLAAQIEFYRMVQADVNNIVGYTTDALTVTNSDKPYTNLADTIKGLEARYQSAIYKHVRYMYL